MLDLCEMRNYIGAVASQLTEARALVKALEALVLTQAPESAIEGIEARLKSLLTIFPIPPADFLPAPAPVCVCSAAAPENCICGALHPDGAALNLGEKARRGRLTATDVFGPVS